MKLATLLAQYLYINKRLDLPGLGSFLLDPSTNIEQETGKQNKATNLEGVSFESNTSVKQTADIIQFISSQTGKIKALAAADLDSHLGLALQFLNIGKPFLFEGIGTLTKIKSGEFSFIPGQAIAAPVKEEITKNAPSSSSAEESLSDYKSVFYTRKQKMTWKKPVAVLLLVLGLALAIWGGYTVYKKTTAKKAKIESEESNKEKTVLVEDTVMKQKDTVLQPKQTATVPVGSYKFILETADSLRAFNRFGRLKKFQWNVQIETKDSLSFKIFMLLPASVSDTVKILDSLTRLNGRRVYIE